jgi:hypothetical protein
VAMHALQCHRRRFAGPYFGCLAARPIVRAGIPISGC